MLTDTTNSPYAKLHPINWDDVRWTDGLWSDIQKRTQEVTVPHIQACFEDEELSHIVKNYEICAGESDGKFAGTDFGDGDFYKWLEAAIYSASETQDKDLSNKIDEYIALIAKCQQDDGYLSTKQIIGERLGNGVKRFGNINDFEVYNFGHLCTTASLHYRLTGKKSFLEIAERAAGYLASMYERFEREGKVQTAVCPSHYMGLVELYRTTGNECYLHTAELAIRLRDKVESGTEDNQDRLPLYRHEKIEGHAVRANYLYAGVADLYMEKGEPKDLETIKRMWRNLVDRKLYITGGCGAIYNGSAPYGNFWIDSKTHQAYGYEYQLPNITAYNETCASIGGVMWAYRMLQIEPNAEYADVLERMMLNVNLAAINMAGDKFFYENQLRRTRGLTFELIWPLTRKHYISSFCCPPNLTRLLAESHEYSYLVNHDSVYTVLYGANHAQFKLDNGADLDIKQESNYPFDGAIKFTISNTGSNEANLNVRIPQWTQSGHLRCAGTTLELGSQDQGYKEIVIPAEAKNFVVELVLDMPARLTEAHPYVEECVGQVAVERGPLVYCVETPDTDAASIDDIVLDPTTQFSTSNEEIAGQKLAVLSGGAYKHINSQFEQDGLYRSFVQQLEPVSIKLIPYFAWDNRNASDDDLAEMRIWMPVAQVVK